MRTNRKIFWWSVCLFITSIIGIICFQCLFKKYPLVNCYDIFKNIFISLVGGAFLSMVTSYVSFHNTKKKYTIEYISEYTSVKNIIIELNNWFQWKCDDVNKIDNIESKETISLFMSIVFRLKNYNYNKMYEILDDYCELTRDNKIHEQMKLMMTLLNKFNLYYMEDDYRAELYKLNVYDEYIMFTYLVPKFLEIKNEYSISKLSNAKKDLIDMTNINEYLKNIYKKSN